MPRIVDSAIKGGSGAIALDQLPQFDVAELLQAAVLQIEAAERDAVSGPVVEAARRDIVAMLASPGEYRGERARDAARTLRRAARTLGSVKDHRVENARLALMSAADMLRTSMGNPIEQPGAPGG